ncbi:hypothetical protein [Nocardia farcinica]|uniref:hypothetical protein n=1 Tax=Nocardia farcinica TaxID=37329 RepID=UPI002453F347|nr:hypothetical protein [Nocardia farcinica]
MEFGDEYIYRAKDFARSQRVRILGIERRKTTTRVDIEFLDGEAQGTRENVPGSRLRGPWAQVDEFDWRWANWERLNEDHYEMTAVEEYAVAQVFSTLIPDEVAEIEGRPIRDCIAVHDVTALEQILQIPMEKLTADIAWFEADDVVHLSSAACILMAELACRQNPTPILELVLKDEGERRERCKHGRTFEAVDGAGERTSTPEQEYDNYRKHHRPRHELLRQWCGYRAVTYHERLLAAEAEVERLDILAARAIGILKEGNAFLGRELEEEHERERITPEKVRPVVDRPLDPSEMPVIVKRRQRRWR